LTPNAPRLSPGWADAWVNYGVARYRQGDVDAAKTAMRQALLSAPGHAAAAANLGAFLRITGEVEEAEALHTPMWLCNTVRQLWSDTNGEFGADSDFTRIVQLVEQWAGGVEVKPPKP